MKQCKRATALTELLTQLRIERNLKQYEVEQLLHMSAGRLCRIETGMRQPLFEELVALAALYAVSLDWIAVNSYQKEVREVISVRKNPSTIDEFHMQHLIVAEQTHYYQDSLNAYYPPLAADNSYSYDIYADKDCHLASLTNRRRLTR